MNAFSLPTSILVVFPSRYSNTLISYFELDIFGLTAKSGTSLSTFAVSGDCNAAQLQSKKGSSFMVKGNFLPKSGIKKLKSVSAVFV